MTSRFTIGEYVASCMQLSMLLEVSAYPKPGNVHRTRDFSDLKYIHFLGAISGLGKFWKKAAESGVVLSKKGKLPEGRLGSIIGESAEAMMEWQTDGNTSLGTILLLVPLSVSAGKTLHEGTLCPEGIRRNLKAIIRSGSHVDTVQVYKTIQKVSPGGLGKIKVLDVSRQESLKEIRERKIALREVFEMSAGYDSIAREWASDFQITFEIGYPFFIKAYESKGDLNTAIVWTYLKILSAIPDTLIARKAGQQVAVKISERAKKILKNHGFPNEGEILSLDEELGGSNGFLNPGSTADLTCSSISIAVLGGIRP